MCGGEEACEQAYTDGRESVSFSNGKSETVRFRSFSLFRSKRTRVVPPRLHVKVSRYEEADATLVRGLSVPIHRDRPKPPSRKTCHRYERIKIVL